MFSSKLLTARIGIPAIAALLSVSTPRPLFSETLLFKQDRDGMPAELLSQAELADLGDPFFELLLRDHADVTSLAKLEQLLQPAVEKRRTFVVSERLADPSRGQHRRTVIAYEGIPNHPASSIMLSVFFDSESFPDEPSAIEALSWDSHRARYNYYKMDSTGRPDDRPAWKFRGDSRLAPLLSTNERRQTCLACHVNGGPIMKELFIPWNNWVSFEVTDLTAYLRKQTADGWPAAKEERFAKGLQGAEELEGAIFSAIQQFNNRRIASALKKNSVTGDVAEEDGLQTVVQGHLLLRHLFTTTEPNFISSRTRSGMHPLAPQADGKPPKIVDIPNSFFLNSNLIGGGTVANYEGLGILQSQQFSRTAQLTPQEYSDLVTSREVRLGDLPGDAVHAWFTPEPSHIDNIMVDLLLRKGIITPQFASAVLAVDLETPILSPARARLLRFVPQSFPFKPVLDGEEFVNRPGHPDALTQQVIAAMESEGENLSPDEELFLTSLRNPNPVELLSQAVAAYLERTKSRLQNSATRPAEAERLFQLLLERRRQIQAHPTFSALDETGDLLLPLP